MGAESELYSLIYVSSAVRLFSREDLVELLETCRENNARVGITGMLLYKDGNFMQALEGAEAAVRGLYEKIQSDTRHSGEIVMWQGPQRERWFAGWSMGFRDLGSEGAPEVPGYSEFLNVPLTNQEFGPDPTRAQKLLLAFKRSM